MREERCCYFGHLNFFRRDRRVRLWRIWRCEINRVEADKVEVYGSKGGQKKVEGFEGASSLRVLEVDAVKGGGGKDHE